MTLLEIQARVTKTTAFTPTAAQAIDVSGLVDGAGNPVDWTIKLQVEALTAAKKARFVFEDTVNDWTASLAGPSCSFVGKLEAASDKVKSWKKQDFPSFRIGITSGAVRLKLAEMDGTNSVTYRAWIEY